MSKKSFVSLSEKRCLICGCTFEDGLLLHKKLRNTLDRSTFTGYGMCPEHQEVIDQGNMFLIEVDNPPSEATKLSLLSASRTGRVVTLPKQVLKQILTEGYITEESPPFVFAEIAMIETVLAIFNQEPTTIH